MPEPLHVLRASAPRRVAGAAMQVALGALLVWVAIAQPPSNPLWLAFLVAFGIACLVLARRGWTRSAVAIVLDEDGLRQEDGTPIAPLEAIASVDRALFSFKPSNGFLIRLRAPLGRAWAPGMWWRLGRRVGVGGVTGGAQTKLMADALTFLVAERDAREG